MGKLFFIFLSKLHPNIENKTILEIGCPSGKLALNLDNYKKWIIVEPNKNKMIDFHEKINFIETFFDDQFTTNEPIDIITHSHLFEHIYKPNNFLQKCYEILTDEGEMIFGVPNMEHFTISNKTPFLGVFLNILFIYVKKIFLICYIKIISKLLKLSIMKIIAHYIIVKKKKL